MRLGLVLFAPYRYPRKPDKFWWRAALKSKGRALTGRMSNCTRLTGLSLIKYLRMDIRKRVKFEPDLLQKTHEMRLHAAAMEHGMDGRMLLERLRSSSVA
ncbi:uncharacterized protein LOC142357711 isoform X2 [Convolutriloba macropyga]|uniref:uncharacterized protein LOC142357711 isoform X2 n=1 Tax=Convolutriloba macropyga TaxID=536237 RepID=UPI003F527429